MDHEDRSPATQWFVGVDGSPDARAALRWAAQLAGKRGETVTPLAAWHPPLALAAMAGGRGDGGDRAAMEAAAVAAADQSIATIEREGVLSPPIVAEGHPAALLLERASDDAVLVVGRRGISALKHRLLGSVSQYLATHADGPVVIVPADWDDRPCTKIVVGFDGSDHAAAALRWALDVAPDTAEIVALAAIDVAPWLSPERAAELHADLIGDARARITEAADAVDTLHRAERSIVLHGPREAFTEAIADADLVVVGPRGIGGLARTMLGSMTTWLLNEAPCPVAVIPSGPGAEQ